MQQLEKMHDRQPNAHAELHADQNMGQQFHILCLDFCAAFGKHFRGRHGGVEKRGGWKTSRMTPLPKRGFWTPPRTVRFPPPAGVSAPFFLYKKPRQSRPDALLEVSKIFRESAFSGTFSSPHTFCTPPYHGPNILGKRSMSDAWILHHTWHQFGVTFSYLMSEFLHYCCYTAGHQDNIQNFTVHHSINARAFFCLENELHSKECNVTHKITPPLHKYCSGCFSFA